LRCWPKIAITFRNGGNMASDPASSFPCSIAAWLSVCDGRQAVDFYKSAFGAKEVYRLEGDGDIVARLSIDGAEFWIGGESSATEPRGGVSIRLILTAADPDTAFARARKAGATEVYP